MYEIAFLDFLDIRSLKRVPIIYPEEKEREQQSLARGVSGHLWPLMEDECESSPGPPDPVPEAGVEGLARGMVSIGERCKVNRNKLHEKVFFAID